MAGPAALSVGRAIRAIAGLAVIAAIACLAGFAWFVISASMPPTRAEDADGIVVLTGGAARVETALHLLADGHARLLLVSGAGPGTSLTELARLARLDPEALGSRVTLGRTATTTIGNAEETARWAHDNGLHSLLVVTAGYHMPRAMVELGRALPDVTLHPYPVVPPALRRPTTFGTLRLLAEEYLKLIAAWLTPYPDAGPGETSRAGSLSGYGSVYGNARGASLGAHGVPARLATAHGVWLAFRGGALVRMGGGSRVPRACRDALASDDVALPGAAYGGPA